MQIRATLASKGQRETAGETRAVRQLTSLSIKLLQISKKKVNIPAFNQPKDTGRKFQKKYRWLRNMGKNAHLLTTTRGTVGTWRQNEGEQEEGAKWGDWDRERRRGWRAQVKS